MVSTIYNKTSLIWLQLIRIEGRAIAEAVSRWLPTAATRVQSRVWSSGICGGQIGAGQVFSEYFDFPCHSFHPILHPHNHPGRYNRPVNGRGAEWTQFGLHPPLCKLKKKKSGSKYEKYSSQLSTYFKRHLTFGKADDHLSVWTKLETVSSNLHFYVQK
jgi:hypothetical protein